MQHTKLPHYSTWHIATVKTPVMWQRNEDEVWLLNPGRRYLLNAGHLPNLNEHLESVSDLEGFGEYRPLKAGMAVTNSRILVERYRDRGIGDLLFLTGPLSYIQHVTGGQANIHMYSLVDRGAVLTGATCLSLHTTLAGPTHADDFQHYHYQWLINSVTECSEEADQLNVYDALYQSLGHDPSSIPAEYKRPSASVNAEDNKLLDQYLYFIWVERQLDLRRTGYYVVAPLCHSSLRSLTYESWLAIIKELSARRPVVVVGSTHSRMPAMGMSVGDFNSKVGGIGANVINGLGSTTLRLLMALINKATCVVSLDSACLYIAQALRVPAVSLWGTHHPGARIGYDQPYMDLAIWQREACAHSPCFGYSSFPVHKCPLGENQSVCEVLYAVTPDHVLARLDIVEKQHIALAPFKVV